MTKVTEALNRIARECGVNAPSSWLSATRKDQVELRDDFMAEAIADVLERVDLPSPIGAQTEITGTGAETYDLPADFLRLQRDELAVYDTNLDVGGTPVTTDGMWTFIKDKGSAGTSRYYRVTGYEGNYSISFYALPSASSTITVSYSSNNWMATDGGVVGSAFTAEEDVLLLPRRIVEAGAVWRFRERRGLPYLDKYNEYEAMIGRMVNDTQGRRVVNFGDGNSDAKWQDLIPSYIPSS